MSLQGDPEAIGRDIGEALLATGRPYLFGILSRNPGRGVRYVDTIYSINFLFTI